MTQTRTQPTTHRIFTPFDGFKAGLLGAAVVAVFFVLTNAFAGRALLETPAALGTLLFGGPELLVGGPVFSAEVLIGYTLVHFAFFGAVGVALSFLANLIANRPSFGGFALLLMLVLQTPIMVLLIAAGPLVAMPLHIAEVVVANILATVAISGYFYASSAVLQRIFKKGLWDHPMTPKQQHRLSLWRQLEETQ